MKDAVRAAWCVIVVKSFARAKSRLTPVLDAAARSKLAHDMFVHVHTVCARQSAIDGVLVATDDDAVADLAVHLGSRVIRDDGKRALGEVVDRALRQVTTLGASHGIVIMSDLPRLHDDDLRDVIDAMTECDVVVGPDRARLGTNLLALRLSTSTPTCFGRSDSFEAHLTRARDAELRTTVVERPGIAFDVDTVEDYAALNS